METKWFEMTDGQSIFVRNYSCELPSARVFLLHGLAEHSGRYEDFATYLVTQGYSVVIHDHRGHGETARGNYGYFASSNGFERIVDDVNEIIQLTNEQQGALPVYLIGHSMGSFVARRFVQKYPHVATKLVLVGTGGDPGMMGAIGKSLAKWKSRGNGATEKGQLLNKLTFGNYNKKISHTNTEFDWLSPDSQVVQDYIDDPQCGFVSTNQLYVDLLSGLKAIHEVSNIKKMNKQMPVLFIAGAMDPVGDYGKGVQKVAASFAKLGMEDVKLSLIEKGRHEILNGATRMSVYEEINRWLN